MKGILTFILTAVAVLSTSSQPLRVQGLSDTQRLLGYTLTDDIDINGAAFGQVGTFSIGAALEPSALAPYAGCRVMGIRLASALNLGRTRTFVYNFTGTAFVPLIEQKQRIYEGWNVVLFNGDGYEIQGDETLFFGFDYVETADMVAAEEGGLCCAGEETDGAFYLYGNYGQGEGLYSVTGAGKLCVQLIVDVSNLPRHDLRPTYLDTGFKYKMEGDTIEVLASFTNVGLDTISHYQVACQIDEMEPVLNDYHQVLPGGKEGTHVFDVVIPTGIAIGMHTLKVYVSQIEDIPCEVTDKHVMEASFAVYHDLLNRHQVYFEVYTDSYNYLSDLLNKAIDNMRQSQGDKVCVVNVHSPRTPLAIDDGGYLFDLYAYTTPSFTINRSYFPGEAHIAYDMNYYLDIFPPEMNGGILSDMAMQDLYSPSFADIALEGSFDEANRQLTIQASGQLLPEARAIYGDVALTMLITVDSVANTQTVFNEATGRTRTEKKYMHRDVLRQFITTPTGDLVTADGDHWTATCTTSIDYNWPTTNLRVVAFLTKAAPEVIDDNLIDMDIINTTSLMVSDIVATQGVRQFVTDGDTPVYYTLDGKKVMHHQLGRGIYLVRPGNGLVRKVFVR